MPAALVLAAGSSERLGEPKQLLPLRGQPLLQHVIDAALQAGLGPVVVVLGHEATRIRGALRLDQGVRVVVNEAHRSGQASSLRAGLEALGPEVTAVAVLLGDQPDVKASAIERVVSAFRASPLPVARARFADSPGHPVVVARSEWANWRSLEGDRGARAVLEAAPGRVLEVSLGGPAPRDVDTRADYERLLASEGS